MSEVKIYGRSDDLVYVEGPGLCEELCCGNDVSYIALSSGTVLKMAFDEHGVWDEPGVWEGEVVHQGAGDVVRIERCDRARDDLKPNTDTVFVSSTGTVTWAECWAAWPPQHEEYTDAVEHLLLIGDVSDLNLDQLRAIYTALTGRSVHGGASGDVTT